MLYHLYSIVLQIVILIYNLHHKPYRMAPIVSMLVSASAILSPPSHTCTKLLFILLCHSLKWYQLPKLLYYLSLCHAACTNFCCPPYLIGPISPTLVSTGTTVSSLYHNYTKLLFTALIRSQKFVPTSYIIELTLTYVYTTFFLLLLVFI